MNDYKENALVFKAFCDENRLRVIRQLQAGEVCACVLLENLTIGQSTLSHHMKILVDSGIVESRKAGKWVHYSLSLSGISKAKTILNTITNTDEVCCCTCNSIQNKT